MNWHFKCETNGNAIDGSFYASGPPSATPSQPNSQHKHAGTARHLSVKYIFYSFSLETCPCYGPRGRGHLHTRNDDSFFWCKEEPPWNERRSVVRGTIWDCTQCVRIHLMRRLLWLWLVAAVLRVYASIYFTPWNCLLFICHLGETQQSGAGKALSIGGDPSVKRTQCVLQHIQYLRWWAWGMRHAPTTYPTHLSVAHILCEARNSISCLTNEDSQ